MSEITSSAIRVIRRDVDKASTDTDLGVLTVYRTPFFSVAHRALVVADFRDAAGAYSQVLQALRSSDHFVAGALGNNEKRGIFHPSIEAAMDDALTA